MGTKVTVGSRWGLLTAVREVRRAKTKTRSGAIKRTYFWLFRCDCGRSIVADKAVVTSRLRKGLHRNCGCVPNRKVLPPGSSAKKHLKNTYIIGAKQRGFSFRLSDKVFDSITASSCYYCGTPPMQAHLPSRWARTPYFYNGIDRIDNRKGYFKSNCRPCCRNCNYAKKSLTEAEFLFWIWKLVTYQNKLEADIRRGIA